MSREVRRVPLDFDFPIGETWTGYLRPDELRLPQCPDCEGRCTTAAYEWVSAIAGMLLMLGTDVSAQERGRHLHPYLGTYMARPARRPSADARELSRGLAGRDGDRFFGHDALDRWETTKAILKAAHLPERWGTCSTCNGDGTAATDEQHAAYDAWQMIPPPTGDGYQLWQTVSEGGPVSPVFATPEELADWIITHGSEFDGRNTPRERLIRWIVDDGHSLGSGVFTSDGRHMSGVEAAAGGL